MANTPLGSEKAEVRIALQALELPGTLTLPASTRALVLFVHGSGSSRFSTRNQFVAEGLNQVGLGTLLFDLLTESEDAVYENRFDIDLLTQRVLDATKWARTEPRSRALRLGLFGASTGAAAALRAAAELGTSVGAVVSRGGRPDLTGPAIADVRSPTLLIVGGNDDVVIELNREAYARLNGPKKLEIVPGATHLFVEPGTLEEVTRLASDWFLRHLASEPLS